jgi:hypothetical protein
MNVHWRKTQKFEFKKKTAILIITGNITMEEQHKKINYNRATIFLPTTIVRNQSLFIIKQQTTTMASMSNITSLPWTKEDTERKEEKEEEERRKHKIGTKKSIDQL